MEIVTTSGVMLLGALAVAALLLEVVLRQTARDRVALGPAIAMMAKPIRVPKPDRDLASDPTTNPNIATDPTTNPNIATDPTTNPNIATDPTTNPNIATDPTTNPNIATDPTTNPNTAGNTAS